MKKMMFSTAMALVLTAGSVQAQGFIGQVVTELQSEGYQRIEVEQGEREFEVAAFRGNRKLEIIYDADTGAILSQEVSDVDFGDDLTPGLVIRDEDGDDHDDDDGFDHDEDDGDDHDGDDDDDRDDDGEDDYDCDVDDDDGSDDDDYGDDDHDDEEDDDHDDDDDDD